MTLKMPSDECPLKSPDSLTQENRRRDKIIKQNNLSCNSVYSRMVDKGMTFDDAVDYSLKCQEEHRIKIGRNKRIYGGEYTYESKKIPLIGD